MNFVHLLRNSFLETLMLQLFMLILKKNSLFAGIVIRIGNGVTNAVPFHEDVMIKENISTLEIDGKNLTDF